MTEIPPGIHQKIWMKQGCDLIDITMDLVNGRSSAGVAMDRISKICQQYYDEGFIAGLKADDIVVSECEP